MHIRKKSSTFAPVMKRSILFFLFVLTTSVFSRAAVISYAHDFNALNGKGAIAFSNSSKTAAIDTILSLTYNCYNTGVFGADLVSKSKISINLPARADSVIITPAIDDLKGVLIYYYTTNVAKFGLNIYISTDSRTWRQLSGEEISGSLGSITAAFSSGSYAVKIVNASSTTSNGISIFKITYETDPCPNCFEYKAE